MIDVINKNTIFIIYLCMTSCAIPLTPLSIVPKSCNTHGSYGTQKDENSNLVSQSYFFTGGGKAKENQIFLREHVEKNNQAECKKIDELVIETETTFGDYLWSLIPLSGKRTVKTYFVLIPK